MDTNAIVKKPGNFFRSELAWPFVIRKEEIQSCLDFLAEGAAENPSILKLVGKSGCGKSFFTRELLTRYAQKNIEDITLYIDVYSADLEASQFFEKFSILLGKPSTANRAAPVQISKSICYSWRRRSKLPKDWRASYAYRVIRDLIGQIPLLGPFIKALIPATISLDGLLDSSTEAAFRYLLKASKNTNVILAIDNVQFLSGAMRHRIESELLDSGRFLKLILIERLDNSAPIDWTPAIEYGQLKEIMFSSVTRDDVRQIVNEVIGQNESLVALSDAIFRRSNGNLKSIWFQLKLANERQSSEFSESLPTTYEEVISSLSQSDQAVLRLVVFLLGGLTVTQLGLLFQASETGIENNTIARAVSDLTALGLLVINSDSNDRVKVEHEIVSRIVSEITPEEEKLELRRELGRVDGFDQDECCCQCND